MSAAFMSVVSNGYVLSFGVLVQTKLQDLHKQIEELTTKVSSLQNENAALHSRTSILEKVLDMRNEQIQVMQETKEVSCMASI